MVSVASMISLNFTKSNWEGSSSTAKIKDHVTLATKLLSASAEDTEEHKLLSAVVLYPS